MLTWCHLSKWHQPYLSGNGIPNVKLYLPLIWQFPVAIEKVLRNFEEKLDRYGADFLPVLLPSTSTFVDGKYLIDTVLFCFCPSQLNSPLGFETNSIFKKIGNSVRALSGRVAVRNNKLDFLRKMISQCSIRESCVAFIKVYSSC